MSTESPDATCHADRRTLLRAATWTAPAVVLATAAPAFASSSTDTVRLAWGDSTRPMTMSIDVGNLAGLVPPIGPASLIVQNTGSTQVTDLTISLAVRFTSGSLSPAQGHEAPYFHANTSTDVTTDWPHIAYRMVDDVAVMDGTEILTVNAPLAPRETRALDLNWSAHDSHAPARFPGLTFTATAAVTSAGHGSSTATTLIVTQSTD